MRRAITLTILIILSFLLQTTVFSFHDVIGKAPNLMLILTMSFGIMRGRREGMLVGFFSGFLMDIFYSSYLGPFMLLYMILGYSNGFFHRSFTTENVMLPVFVIFIDECIFNLAVYIITFLLRGKTELKYYFIHTFLPEAIYSTVITAIIYKVFVTINKSLKKKASEKK